MNLSYCEILTNIVLLDIEYFFCCFTEASNMPTKKLNHLFLKIKNKINSIEKYLNENKKEFKNIFENPNFYDNENGFYFKEFFLNIGKIENRILSKKIKKIAEYLNEFLEIMIKNCNEIDDYILFEIKEYIEACKRIQKG